MSDRINLWGRQLAGSPQKRATAVRSVPAPKSDEKSAPSAPPRRDPAVVTRPSTRTVEDVTVHTTTAPPPVAGPNDVEAGSWETRQTLPVPHTGDRRLRSQRKRLVAPDKARRNPMCFTVSDEEAAILRAHAATLDMTFSEWVRKTLFKAANRKIPARSRGGSAVDGD